MVREDDVKALTGKRVIAVLHRYCLQCKYSHEAVGIVGVVSTYQEAGRTVYDINKLNHEGEIESSARLFPLGTQRIVDKMPIGEGNFSNATIVELPENGESPKILIL